MGRIGDILIGATVLALIASAIGLIVFGVVLCTKESEIRKELIYQKYGKEVSRIEALCYPDEMFIDGTIMIKE